MTVDRAGRVYVSDSENHRIQVFDCEGKVALVFDGSDSRAGRLKQPNGLALDGNGRLYVADTGNNRLVVLRLIDRDGSAAAY